jgi:hypothetical protein
MLFPGRKSLSKGIVADLGKISISKEFAMNSAEDLMELMIIRINQMNLKVVSDSHSQSCA